MPQKFVTKTIMSPLTPAAVAEIELVDELPVHPFGSIQL